MISVQYPEPSFQVKHIDNRPFIFDDIRKKWLLLQDEEWVRQNFIQYLLQVLQYPKSYIALEKEIMLGELKKRFDILVYDPHYKPWMLIECKSQTVSLRDDVLHQALRYQISMPAQYLIITNGTNTFGWQKLDNALTEIQSLPEFPF